MRRLRRTYQRNIKKKRAGSCKYAFAAGTLAAITWTNARANESVPPSSVLPQPDVRHCLAVTPDRDGDLLKDLEESALGYDPLHRDQNQNDLADGMDLARHCATVIQGLPENDPNHVHQVPMMVFGLETCQICGQSVNMGFTRIVNPDLGLDIQVPYVALHYMEHGSFSYDGTVNSGRLDVPLLMRILNCRFPGDLDIHQQALADIDLDGDLLSDKEELQLGLNPYHGDQNNNLMMDGPELAVKCQQAVKELPEIQLNEQPPATVYRINYLQRGIEYCEVCGEDVNMGYWEVVNPQLRQSIQVHEIALHAMLHGTFNYKGLLLGGGPLHEGRLAIAQLLMVLDQPDLCSEFSKVVDPNDP